jgi:hypothetical protein
MVTSLPIIKILRERMSENLKCMNCPRTARKERLMLSVCDPTKIFLKFCDKFLLYFLSPTHKIKTETANR